MKKKIFLALAFCLFLGTSKVSAATVKSYFNDDNFFGCFATAASIDETTEDSAFDFTSVTSLDCSNKEITDTTGLEKLTELVTLNLKNNSIASIDVSANTKLVSLYLNNNNISTIDLSKNTELVNFNMNDNNLTGIDVSTNTKLVNLYLNNNNISTIDLSKNTDLVELELGTNNISTIDLSKNTELVRLILSKNKLTAIDLSKNTKLEKLVLLNNPLLETVELALGEEFDFGDYIKLPETYSATYQVSEEVVTFKENVITATKVGSETAKLVIKNTDTNEKEEFTSTITVEDRKGTEEKTTSDTTENPKTGIYGGSIALVVIAGGAYLVMKNKNKYNSVR